MKTRILTGVVLFAVLLPALIFSGTYVWNAAIALLCMIAVCELLQCFGLMKKLAISIPSLVFSVFLPVATRLFDPDGFVFLAISTILILIWFFTASLFSRGKIPIDSVGFFGSVYGYVLWGFSLLALIRMFPDGEYLFMLPIAGALVCDAFAYFTGKLIGRHKLIPDVSPKKTVEGAIGGVLFDMGFFALYGWIVSLITGLPVRILALALLAVPVALISMVGDLVMSLLKRHFGIKDFSQILPGHGGILDRFDSVIATSIVLYLLVRNTNLFLQLFGS